MFQGPHYPGVPGFREHILDLGLPPVDWQGEWHKPVTGSWPSATGEPLDPGLQQMQQSTVPALRWGRRESLDTKHGQSDSKYVRFICVWEAPLQTLNTSDL